MKNITENIQAEKSANHLINESSPYLLQHAYNPVDWYPWSEESLEKARVEDKPIFLSIGYAACHWCHVMEKESFENEDIAAILNEHFVSIKVDREQRPDLDQIYMSATMAINGSGGWPMSVFLTPDLKPFFAGTYFPPNDMYGRPGFRRLITQIAAEYRDNRQNIETYAQSLTEALKSSYTADGKTGNIDTAIIRIAADRLMKSYDRVNGGFGAAPKFPHPTDLSFMMKVYSSNKDNNLLSAVEHTLQSMARGGIYDQIGGGFHRYAVDATWLVPHFEKMLYDNALLVVTYSEAHKITGNEYYKKIVRETQDFMIREMQDKQGGFYSSLDADSEGEEGRYYVWKKEDVERLLGKNSGYFCNYYNITDGGNFEHQTNIPNINGNSDRYKESAQLTEDEFEDIISKQRQVLFDERQKRIRPITDDKILTSWNGLAISGFSKGFQITGDEKYRLAALRAAEFIRDKLIKDDKLLHSFRFGKISRGQFLEDYAYYIQGLIDLYEIAYDYEWIDQAEKLAKDAIGLFSDESGNLYLSPANQKDHFIRPKDIADGALPAPGSVFIHSLVKLADLTGDKTMFSMAEQFITALSPNINRTPHGMISAVSAYDYLIADKIEIILVGEKNRDRFLDEIYKYYCPNGIIVVSDRGEEPIALLEGRQSNGKTTAYICKNFACNLPAETPEELKGQLANLRGN